MTRLALLVATLLLVGGCSQSESTSKYVEQTPAGPVDTRVSPHGLTRPTLASTTDEEHVEYHNPHTGTTSDYDLEVDRDSDGKVERINFPNEGWLEINGDTVDNGDGTETYTKDDGTEYTITKPEKSEPSDSG